MAVGRARALLVSIAMLACVGAYARSALAAGLPALEGDVRPLLDRACSPCHSDDRRDPWYAKLAPSSWSTTGARRALNFSDWARYDEERRSRAIGAVGAVVDAGTMPPADYTFFNHGAKLTIDEKQLLIRWAAAAHP
jgi:hypothetical protein